MMSAVAPSICQTMHELTVAAVAVITGGEECPESDPDARREQSRVVAHQPGCWEGSGHIKGDRR